MIVAGNETAAQTAFQHACGNVSLDVFTTLAPAGAFAFIALALYTAFAHMSEAEEERLEHFLIIPLSVVLVGLIASTNHLGRPANSLFVLTGIGRSPLSNEIWASIIFAGIAWLGWLAGFSRKLPRSARRAILYASAVAGACQIWFTSNAYHINTVVTWALPFTQINQMLAAVMGGSVLTVLTLAAAGRPTNGRAAKALLALALAAAVCAVVSEALQNAALAGITSALTQASALEPLYPAGIAVSTALAIASVCTSTWALAHGRQISVKRATVSAALMLCGVFVARFCFYGLYLTVGI